ncbi:DUF6597 domain-containing transcriptional factor [Spirosoma montaniterrae]|uniref:DUF6597 domain-containing protein n=1 Tax=Spirosoma montaniterrae TaxID=1178516 RepID=A0A1P9WYU9_9BACT|nr:DUF6597 domain-containing transcriptional factor [Spirosoma montaniterrae]AQG80555.1 hypothetical protein AWR27_15220 [Spirosoma montaniterrae]
METLTVELIHQPHFDRHYQLLAPASDLLLYIESYWMLDLRNPQHQQSRFVEINLAKLQSILIVNLGNPFEVFGRQGERVYTCTHSALVGYHTRRLSYKHQFGNYLIGVTFHPAAANHLFRVQGQELMNQLLPLDVLLPNASLLEAQLAEDGYPATVQKVLNTWMRLLVGRATPDSRLGYVQQALQPDKLHGANYFSRQLASLLCVTNRSLERYFKEHMALSPKHCLRIQRFRQALPVYGRYGSAIDWTEWGYHDFSHFMKDYHHFMVDLQPDDAIRSNKSLSPNDLGL